MSSRFAMVPLGTAAIPVQRPEVPAAGKLYRQIGVRLWGEGAYEREPIDGSQTRYPTLSRVEAGDIVVNKIWARNGSVAVVCDALDGCYGSSEFPTFAPVENQLEARWFHWLTKTKGFWQRCDEKSRGTSGQNRIRSERFLEIEIPLPSVSEQRRIVARIEELAAKIEEARGLRRAAVAGTRAILDSAMNAVWADQAGWNSRPLGEIATASAGQVDPRIEPYASLPHVNGEVIESGTCRLLVHRSARDDGVRSGKFHFQPGAVLYSKLRPYLRKAVQVGFEGVCSADIYALRVVSPDVEPRFFMYSLVSGAFTDYANSLSGRTRMPKLNQVQLFRYRMPYPSLEAQRRIVSYLDRVQADLVSVRRVQAETATELDALLPAVLDRAFSGGL